METEELTTETESESTILDESLDEGTETQETASEEATAEGEARPTRKERQKERAREHREIVAARERAESLAAENQRLMAQMAELQARQVQATEGISRALEQQGKAKEPTLREKIFKRLRAGASRITEDPATAEAYLEEQAAVIEETSAEIGEARARAIVAEEIKKLRTEQAQQQRKLSPEEQRLQDRFTWIFDETHWPAVSAGAKLLASKHSRNLNDPKVREATVREAAALHAKTYGLDVRGDYQSRPGAMINGGGRTFGGSGETTAIPTLTEQQKAWADQTPGFKEMPREKRYVSYAKMLASETKRA